jgi:hypothetical protein
MTPPPARQTRPLAAALRLALAGAMLFGAPAGASARCADPQEQSSFEVVALKTELMVQALACNQQGPYNSFVQRHRDPLLEANNVLVRHFTRAQPGRAGERASDTYVTNLANMRQQAASSLGSDFCVRNRVIFDEVMALSSPADLAAYAAGKDLVPDQLGACPAGQRSAAAPAPRSPRR